MERRQQQFWLIPGHQKNAATRDALIYARQCLITEIAFSRESSLKFNAISAWQYSRTHDRCDKIQYPLAQQGSLLTSRPERELGKPIYTAPDWAQISPLWQGRFLAEEAPFERTKLPWHCKGLLDHCHSVVHTTTATQPGTILPRWTLQPEQSGQPFWISWLWPRPFTAPWQNSSAFQSL